MQYEKQYKWSPCEVQPPVRLLVADYIFIQNQVTEAKKVWKCMMTQPDDSEYV